MYAKGTDPVERGKVMVQEGGEVPIYIFKLARRERISEQEKTLALDRSRDPLPKVQERRWRIRAQMQICESPGKLSSNCFCSLSKLDSKVISIE